MAEAGKPNDGFSGSIAVKAIAGLMAGKTDAEIAANLDQPEEWVIAVRQHALREQIPLLPTATETRRIVNRVTNIIQNDEAGFFRRVRQVEHCNKSYSMEDKFCSRCGEILEFPTVLETLIGYFEERLQGKMNDQTRKQREEWVAMLRKIDSVAATLDETRNRGVDVLARNDSEDRIPLSKVSNRLKNVLIREGLRNYQDVVKAGRSYFTELRGIGETTISEVDELMSSKKYKDSWQAS